MSYHRDTDQPWVIWPIFFLLIGFMALALIASGCATKEGIRSGHVKGSSNYAIWVDLDHPQPMGRKQVIKVPVHLVKELEPGMMVAFTRPNGERIAHVLEYPVPAWYIRGASNDTGEHVPVDWITDVIYPIDDEGHVLLDYRWKGGRQ